MKLDSDLISTLIIKSNERNTTQEVLRNNKFFTNEEKLKINLFKDKIVNQSEFNNNINNTDKCLFTPKFGSLGGNSNNISSSNDNTLESAIGFNRMHSPSIQPADIKFTTFPHFKNDSYSENSLTSFKPKLNNQSIINLTDNNTYASRFETEVLFSGNLFSNSMSSILGNFINSQYDDQSMLIDIELVKSNLSFLNSDTGTNSDSNNEKISPEFQKVYDDIKSIFSQPIKNMTLNQLRKYLNLEEIYKLETILIEYLNHNLKKVHHFQLYENSNEKLYLKIDPKQNRCSITKSKGSSLLIKNTI